MATMASLVPNAAWSGAESPTPPTGCGPRGTGDGASPRHATARSRSTGGKREIWRVVRSHIHDRRCRSAKTPRFHIIYVSVNAYRPGRSRAREAIADVRHVFLEEDVDGPGLLAALTTRRDLPPPSYVLHSSPDRLHVLWRVRNISSRATSNNSRSTWLASCDRPTRRHHVPRRPDCPAISITSGSRQSA